MSSTNTSSLLDTLVTEKDEIYEQDILAHPHQLKSWVRYIESVESMDHQLFIYARALLQLPGSFKLWKGFLQLRLSLLLTPPPDAKIRKTTQKYAIVQDIIHTLDYQPAFPLSSVQWARTRLYFEKALILCHRMPVLWLTYLGFLMHQPHLITLTRRTFDRALQALPVSQHPMIWKLYLVFAERVGGETCIRIWRRFIKMEPSASLTFASILLDLKPPRIAEAARLYVKVLESPTLKVEGKSTFELWTELCALVTENPDAIDETVDKTGKMNALDVDSLLRNGIKKFTDQVGKIYNSLARWWLLQGEFEKARDVYEEALKSVHTVYDFSLVFDTFAKMEEDLISFQMSEFEKNGPKKGLEEVDVDMGLARFERLMERRPFLLNDVLLRQNPHNIIQWLNRIDLWKQLGNTQQVLDTYQLALKTISPKQVLGNLGDLWIEFANYYLSLEDVDGATKVYESAVTYPFRRIEELESVWISFAEMGLSRDPSKTLVILGRAVATPKGSPGTISSIKFSDESIEPCKRIFKSLKLWSFYVDVQESLGTLESTKAIYDAILDLKIANPQIIINYASMMEEASYYEESFRIYEKGIELFGYPIAFEIVNIYLDKFIKRFQGTKIERTRDLFEHSLDKIPDKFVKAICLKYAQFELEFGLAKRAMDIYDRATLLCAKQDLYTLYKIYISKAASYFGLASTRDIYAKAIQVLPNKECRDTCLAFASLEIKLGEIDRARVIYGFGSQMSDPSLDPEYWKQWQEFEIKYGNEDTFKEMLRIKRSVLAHFNSDVKNLSRHLMSSNSGSGVGLGNNLQESNTPRTIADLEQEVLENQKMSGFVRAKWTEPVASSGSMDLQESNVQGQGQGNLNPDEIQIIDDDDDEKELQEQEEEEVGAKERLLKRARQE